MKYCIERKLIISSIEIDDGVSARNPKKLQGLQTIISNIESGETLLVLDLSRFSRNTLGGLQILEDLHKRNVKIYSVLDGMNYDTPAARHCVRTTISCAELESDIKSAKLKASIQNIKNMGGYIGSRAPFGYKIIREGHLRKLVKNISEQNILSTLYNIDYTITSNNVKPRFLEISKQLNQRGLTQRGKKFTPQTVRYLIANRHKKYQHTVENTQSKKRQQVFNNNRSL
jgi:DNA invertase Pin-like site-specific DNA recombinase